MQLHNLLHDHFFLKSWKLQNPIYFFSGEEEDAGETDHFDALETVSNEFTYGNFLWTLRLRPQPLLGVQTAAQTASTKSSWTSPIQKVLQQQRINSSLSSGGNRDGDFHWVVTFLDIKKWLDFCYHKGMK